MDEVTLQTRLQQAENCIKFLNENLDAWRYLRKLSDPLLRGFPAFPIALVSDTDLLQQYQDYKAGHYLNLTKRSEYWLPISADVGLEEAYIDLTSPELPILVADWKYGYEYVVKTACPSLLKFIEKDYPRLQKEEKEKDTSDIDTLNQTVSVANRMDDERQTKSAIKVKKSFLKLLSFLEKMKKVDCFAKCKGLVNIYVRYYGTLVCGGWSLSDLNVLLAGLPDLKLDENYVLDNYNPHSESPFFRTLGLNLQLYVRLKSVEKPRDIDFKRDRILESYCRKFRKKYKNEPEILEAKLKKLHSQMEPLPKLPECEDPFKHITLPFTKEAIWQAYLLKQVGHKIGMYWHGLYDQRIFINRKKDIDSINLNSSHGDKVKLEQFKIEAKASWAKTMRPMVILDGDKAYISHYWFDYWSGLSQVECWVSYDSHSQKITDFLIKESDAIVCYDCGLKY